MAASVLSDISVTLPGQGDQPSCSASCNVDAVNVSNHGRSQTFSFGGATGGACFATRGAVNGLCL